MMSENIAELAAALAKAQAEMPAVKKTKTAKVQSQKGNYQYSYADLSDVRDAAFPVLARHELAVVQVVRPGRLLTRLIHSSGQWLEAEHELPTNVTPQVFGSALTYARRYSLSALVGIAAEEDDDGQAASSTPPSARAAPATKPAQRGEGLGHGAPARPSTGAKAPTKAETIAANVGRELAEAIRQHTDPDALRSWWAQEAERIHALPQNFRDRLSQRYDERIDELDPPGAREDDGWPAQASELA